ncbi:hypothetical protein N9M86_03830 [Euryarchaeota archaeon]|nr:hypothetical protein [Candidatus Poseidoniaceae archaeon]MDA8546823.1 hypothetical protein [Euryarchaeota archaeon]MDA8588068.1 hypothetical protein [Euryarchaeota archaeon]MDA8594275.1 hypothetical protein [Euryarchaeota archaeon]MDA8609735.1 hypothetical protein [Euryarchaeota archaeon]
MAGGGAAPAMKMSDLFILLGVTFLIGGLFIHGLASSETVTEESEPYSNGASLLKGDSLEFTIDADNESTVLIEIMFEDQGTVFTESMVLGPGDSNSADFEATESGYYSYTVDFTKGEGEVFVDVDRQLLIDFIIYPIGALCLVFGLYKRKDEKMGESVDAVLEDID